MVNLGDEVKDKVSGFRGVATARHEYLNGCARITVQPSWTAKDKKLPECCTFDEPQLEIIRRKKVKQGSKLTGGPDKFMDEGR